MVKLTAPQLREILTNGQQYRRAVRLLTEQWEVRSNQFKYERVEPQDVSWARLLQDQQLISGNYDLND